MNLALLPSLANPFFNTSMRLLTQPGFKMSLSSSCQVPSFKLPEQFPNIPSLQPAGLQNRQTLGVGLRVWHFASLPPLEALGPLDLRCRAQGSRDTTQPASPSPAERAQAGSAWATSILFETWAPLQHKIESSQIREGMRPMRLEMALLALTGIATTSTFQAGP